MDTAILNALRRSTNNFTSHASTPIVEKERKKVNTQKSITPCPL